MATIICATGLLAALSFTDIVGSTGQVDDVKRIQKDIKDGFDLFSVDLATSLTTAATLQNVWADAYIGKVFPSVPPHFGGGINLGVASLDLTGLKQVATALDFTEIPARFVLPVLDIEARIGGVFLPFDFGISIMKFDTSKITLLDQIKADYYSIGVSFRYCVLEQSLVLPNVSIGAIYNFTKGSVAVGATDAQANINYKSQTYGLEAQVSKKFVGIITPFAGGRLLASNINNDWAYSKKIEGLNTEITAYLEGEGILTGGKIADNGSLTYNISDYTSIGDLNMQLFAGVGINLLIMQFTPSVSYDLTQRVWGVALSTHIKL